MGHLKKLVTDAQVDFSQRSGLALLSLRHSNLNVEIGIQSARGILKGH
jgi:hypothetical protein